MTKTVMELRRQLAATKRRADAKRDECKFIERLNDKLETQKRRLRTYSIRSKELRTPNKEMPIFWEAISNEDSE